MDLHRPRFAKDRGSDSTRRTFRSRLRRAVGLRGDSDRARGRGDGRHRLCRDSGRQRHDQRLLHEAGRRTARDRCRDGSCGKNEIPLTCDQQGQNGSPGISGLETEFAIGEHDSTSPKVKTVTCRAGKKVIGTECQAVCGGGRRGHRRGVEHRAPRGLRERGTPSLDRDERSHRAGLLPRSIAVEAAPRAAQAARSSPCQCA